MHWAKQIPVDVRPAAPILVYEYDMFQISAWCRIGKIHYAFFPSLIDVASDLFALAKS